jgi:hypothetical protein
MTFARRGDRLRFPADLFNKLQAFFANNPEATEAAGALDSVALDWFDSVRPRFANETDVDLKPGAVVALADPFPNPAVDAEKFRTTPTLYAQTPVAGDGTGGVNRIVGVVVERASATHGSAGAAVVLGLAVVRVVAGADPVANANPAFVGVVPGDPSACQPTADQAKAFASVVYCPPVGAATYALVRLGSAAGNPANIKFARSTGANQTQPNLTNGRVGLVEVLPVDDPSASPASGASPLVLAVVGRSGTSYSSDVEEPRFYLPAGSKVAYLESTAYSGAVGFVVSDHDEREQFNLYWGKVRDLQGAAETRDSGHFALPKQVRVTLLNRATGADATTAPLVWVMVPTNHGLRPGSIICFRQQDGLRDGSIDDAISDQNWGEDAWENGVFVALNVGSGNVDCPEFECGALVGAKLPRVNSTGILRMFRGQRPNSAISLAKTNRPDKEIQIGVGVLGRWTYEQGGVPTVRIALPGACYKDAKEPGGPWYTSNGNPVPFAPNMNVQTRRHLVSRGVSSTEYGSAVTLDWSAPGWTGCLYTLGTLDGNQQPQGQMDRVMLRVVDGLIVGGGTCAAAITIGKNLDAWNPNSAAPFAHSIYGDNQIIPFDGGCCPKYDNSPDVTQGP